MKIINFCMIYIYIYFETKYTKVDPLLGRLILLNISLNVIQIDH